MSDKIELLPCPFCGQQDAFVEQLDSDASVVICQGRFDEHSACLARGPVAVQESDDEDQPGKEAAIREWNRRAALAQHPAPVNKSVIRDVFLRNGFTIKEGQTDLKPYVYAAAEELLSLDGKAVAAAPAAPAAQEPVAWISVEDGLPKSGMTVLACYTNSHGKVRRIRAEYVASKSRELDDFCDPDESAAEYDEETDQHYWSPGWYECIDNWSDYTSLAVTEGDVTHWMPLPAVPGDTAPPAAEQPDTVAVPRELLERAVDRLTHGHELDKACRELRALLDKEGE